ncbi:hypothetical protein B0T17DRAFT_615114 [Bombardia bombarda]|uniref:Arrestin-like N-terminal domain-containing protein n=1 Tax=Bombardia bombarda TaxID=252184 RepID=A0AA39X8K9_9PEZI|nr:hypothetical protein B0T17DRAFT_615114 [Bombardia bombarda]
MPQRLSYGDQYLRIQLLESDNPSTFAPGDTINGNVIRSANFYSPRATITIRLTGRAKVKRDFDKSPVYRSRYTLLDLSQTLFHGPLTISQPRSWPFGFTLPTCPSPGLVRKSQSFPKSLLPLSPDTIASHPLPFSFKYHDSEGLLTFVEYFLTAKLHIQQDLKKNLFRSAAALSAAAILPITVSPAPHGELVDQNPKLHSITASACSHSLLPGMNHTPLSLKQNVKKFFQCSSVPHLAFDVKLAIRQTIQLDLDAKDPVSIMVGIVPVGRNAAFLNGTLCQQGHFTWPSFKLRRLRLCITHNFDTYNTRRYYRLDWELKLEVGRERVWLQGRQSVTFVGPCGFTLPSDHCTTKGV